MRCKSNGNATTKCAKNKARAHLRGSASYGRRVVDGEARSGARRNLPVCLTELSRET